MNVLTTSDARKSLSQLLADFRATGATVTSFSVTVGGLLGIAEDQTGDAHLRITRSGSGCL